MSLGRQIAALTALSLCLSLLLPVGIHLTYATWDPARGWEEFIEQEKPLIEAILEKHPYWTIYEPDGRYYGYPVFEFREKEWLKKVDAPRWWEVMGWPIAAPYRLYGPSLLDLPTPFVGTIECAVCHFEEYIQWYHTRHDLVVRRAVPEEIPEKTLLTFEEDPEHGILPLGICVDVVHVIVGTMRQKYAYADAWLLRGTYSVEGGWLREGTGIFTPGANQYTPSFEAITIEHARQIAEWIPEFPTSPEETIPYYGSPIWGVMSYAALYRRYWVVEPYTTYCELCKPYIVDFPSVDALIDALGDAELLKERTFITGIECEICHGPGAHMVGIAPGHVFKPTPTCERCHLRMQIVEDPEVYDFVGIGPEEEKIYIRINPYVKAKMPSCGTQGAQMLQTAHYERGMRCTTCHCPHAVTIGVDPLRDMYTRCAIRMRCEDCHVDHAEVFQKRDVHIALRCESCHMPQHMSCTKFIAFMFPEYGLWGERRAHVWKIDVHPYRKAYDPEDGIFNRIGGYYFLDLMWTCARTSVNDYCLVVLGLGCHSPAVSRLPEHLHFFDQRMAYETTMEWIEPVDTTVAKVKEMLEEFHAALPFSLAPAEDRAIALNLVAEAEEIVDLLEEVSAVHAPAWCLEQAKRAEMLVSLALELIEAS